MRLLGFMACWLIFTPALLLSAEVRVEMTKACAVPTKWEVAPYRIAFVAHEYRLLEPWGDHETGTRVRVFHRCLSEGRPLKTPGPKDVGKTFHLRLQARKMHEKTLKSQYVRDNLGLNEDVPYYVAVRLMPVAGLNGRFDHGSSLSDKIVELALLWDEIEVIAIGDSRTEAGIMPSILADHGFNLATPSAGIPSIVTLGEKYGMEPPGLKVLVLGLSPRMFSAHWSDGAIDTLRSSPAYRRDEEIGVSRAIEQFQQMDAGSISAWRKQRAFPYSTRGFLDYSAKRSAPSQFAEPDEVRRLIILAKAKPDFEFAADRLEQLRDFVDLAVDRDVLVLAFLQPVYPPFWDSGLTDNDGTGIPDHALLARKLLSLSPDRRYRFVDANSWAANQLEARHFNDADHLSKLGAAVLSRKLRSDLVNLILDQRDAGDPN